MPVDSPSRMTRMIMMPLPHDDVSRAIVARARRRASLSGACGQRLELRLGRDLRLLRLYAYRCHVTE